MTMAQRNSDPVGEPTWGMAPAFRENVTEAGQVVEAYEDQRPDAGRKKCGDERQLHHRPARPRHLHEEEGADHRRPRSVAMAAKLPATPITTAAIGGASRLNRWMARTPSPLPITIRGASGPSTAPRLSVANAADDNAEELDGRRRALRI